MTQVSLVKTQSGGLFPLTESDKAVLDQKRIGTVLECSVKMLRNPRFHRKFFALLNLGFDYWQPLGGAISPSERHMVDNFANFLSAVWRKQEKPGERRTGVFRATGPTALRHPNREVF
ncbi:TPA: DUF1367 family protein [Photobacterium damselae]